MDAIKALADAIVITPLGATVEDFAEEVIMRLRGNGYDVQPYDAPDPAPFSVSAEQERQARLKSSIATLRNS